MYAAALTLMTSLLQAPPSPVNPDAVEVFRCDFEQDTDRNYFMSPDEAKEYGLIDKVYEPPKVGKKK